MWAMIAGLMTTYYGPGASGSGVAELIGYMNGVNYPDFISIPTLITKTVGVTLAVTGKLCVGKEGPLAHIGANIGIMVLYIPGFEFLRNDEKKRHFIAAGASAGVSVAFGAPIGGALFCYEMSKPNTFWKFTMIWKVFFSCSIGNLTMAIFTSIYKGENQGWNTSALKFGNASTLDANDDVMILLPGAIVIGILGGLIGPLFINLNTRINVYRKKLLTSGSIKVIETTIFGFGTAGIFFMLPYLFGSCNEVEGDKHLDYQKEAWCKEPGNGMITYNPLASIFWASEGEIISNLMSSKFDIEVSELFVFMFAWYIQMTITYGTNVPAGLFLPGMIVGSALGEIMARSLKDNTNFGKYDEPD